MTQQAAAKKEKAGHLKQVAAKERSKVRKLFKITKIKHLKKRDFLDPKIRIS